METISATTAGKRGRKPKLVGKDLEVAVQLVKDTNGNVSQALRVLTARNAPRSKVEVALAKQRAALGYPKPLKLTQPTLAAAARKAGLTLIGRGRPVEAVAPTVATATTV